MDFKQILHKYVEKINGWWSKGNIQRTFRITYDVIWNIILFFIIIGIIGIFFGIGVGAGYFASLVKDEPIRSYKSMEKAIYSYEETSKLFFANNIYLGDVQSDLHREETSLDHISENLINAVIATEDEYFQEHSGVVPKAIVRAIAQEALNTDTKTGGSTLTQQLIKNQLLTNEVSFERKAKEILLALRLEKFFTKDQIIEAYLNVIPYGRSSSGRNIAGIQTAAQGVFGIDAKDLNIAQAAYLAGIPQNPYIYTPFSLGGEVKDKEGLEPGLNRMKTVLKRMYDENYITKKEYNEALKYDIVADFTKKKDLSRESYPYLMKELQDRAIEVLTKVLAEKDGYTEKDLRKDEELNEKYRIIASRDLERKGYQIHSTIDKKMYDAMQKVTKEYQYYGPDRTREIEDSETGEKKTVPDPVQTGSVLIENKTGKILSFVGGRGFDIDQYNYATEVYRQNGSTMKPLLGYAPAMEQGVIQPGSPIADIPVSFGSYTPGNYANTYYGLVSAREALAQSHNVSAIQVYNQILPMNPAKKYLSKMGFSKITKVDHENLSTVLGGLYHGTTVEENTNAFTTFSNQGKFIKSYMIEKITTKDGKVIYEHQSKPVKVFSPQTAFLTYDMMRDVIRSGTAGSLQSYLRYGGVDWAGKTGTTNDYKDAWFVATNPNVTFGTWIGYNSGKGVDYCPGCSLSYGQRNIKLWAELINAATEIKPDLLAPQQWTNRPEGIVDSSICAISGLLPSELCSKAGLVRSDIFNAQFVPNKVDDSLVSGAFVEVDGKSVPAGPNTPKEFVKGDGYSFNPEFLKEKGYDRLSDLSVLFPRTNRELWEKIGLPKGQIGGSIKDTGNAPSPPTSLSVSGNTLSWQKPGSKNIVGYRIYRADKQNGSFSLIGNTIELHYSISKNPAVYKVKAVDYFGRESDVSKEVVAGKIPKDNDKKNGANKQNAKAPVEQKVPKKPNNQPKDEPNDNQQDDDQTNQPDDEDNRNNEDEDNVDTDN